VGDLAWRNPITGIPACCARAASGHATAVPPSVLRIFVVACHVTLRLGVIHAIVKMIPRFHRGVCD
jgi:hypothetical protein